MLGCSDTDSRFLYCGVLLQAIAQDKTWANAIERPDDLRGCLEQEFGWRQGKLQWGADHRILPCRIRLYPFISCREFIWWCTRFERFPAWNTGWWTVHLYLPIGYIKFMSLKTITKPALTSLGQAFSDTNYGLWDLFLPASLLNGQWKSMRKKCCLHIYFTFRPWPGFNQDSRVNFLQWC